MFAHQGHHIIEFKREIIDYKNQHFLEYVIFCIVGKITVLLLNFIGTSIKLK